MDDATELEEFNRIAYAYRTWPAHDVEGVAARFADLVRFVEDRIEAARDAAGCGCWANSYY